jgi:hypothetical protein
MGRIHDEQVDEEIASNAPEEFEPEEEMQAVELNLETGEIIQFEPPTPSWVLETLKELGEVLVKFAENRASVPKSLEESLKRNRSKERGLKMLFWFSLFVLGGIAELVYPFLGLLVLSMYFFYFSLINLSGVQGTVERLKQALMYASMKNKAEEESETPTTGHGNFV